MRNLVYPNKTTQGVVHNTKSSGSNISGVVAHNSTHGIISPGSGVRPSNPLTGARTASQHFSGISRALAGYEKTDNEICKETQRGGKNESMEALISKVDENPPKAPVTLDGALTSSDLKVLSEMDRY